VQNNTSVKSEIRVLKVSCLCLLDLSAAFDTIDHNILITCVSSWFSIHDSVLSWFKSYWSSRSFSVKCDNNLSSFHTSSCGVPQSSVLRPLLFIMYTTPFSTLISSLSLDHHLCADDAQLFFFFTQSTLTQAFLTSKTLFNRSLPGWLLIFLLLTPLRLNSCSSDSETNLPKYTTLHLTPPTLLENSASSLMNILLSLTKLQLSPKPVTIKLSTSLYPALPLFLSCLYYCCLCCSLQTWLL